MNVFLLAVLRLAEKSIIEKYLLVGLRNKNAHKRTFNVSSNGCSDMVVDNDGVTPGIANVPRYFVKFMYVSSNKSNA